MQLTSVPLLTTATGHLVVESDGLISFFYNNMFGEEQLKRIGLNDIFLVKFAFLDEVGDQMPVLL